MRTRSRLGRWMGLMTGAVLFFGSCDVTRLWLGFQQSFVERLGTASADQVVDFVISLGAPGGQNFDPPDE